MTKIVLENDILKLYRICDLSDSNNILYITSNNSLDSSLEIFDGIKKANNNDINFYVLEVADWDRYLTPWKTDEKLKDRTFLGDGNILLGYIQREIIPLISNSRDVYIAGYSLAGLFALWSVYSSNIFDGVISCSGSLWYPGWNDFITNNTISKKIKVYLSLGQKETKTKNHLMKSVGDNTSLQYNLLKNNPLVTHITFDLNEGGHFTNVTERIIKGIVTLSLYSSSN